MPTFDLSKTPLRELNSALHGLPAGTNELEVWHPQLRPGRPAPRQTIVVNDAPARVTFSLPLLSDPRQTGDRSRY